MAFPAVAVVVGPVDEVRVMVRCETEWIVVRARGAGLPRLWRDRDEIESTWGWVKREVRLVRLVRSASWAAGKIAHGDVCREYGSEAGQSVWGVFRPGMAVCLHPRVALT